ncbi:MAG: TlpA family protein disulfide reductase [Sandaracinaceae bacterium]|nr:TlpA family protein disulfide reductase [Sandaracinaceae bacterium]
MGARRAAGGQRRGDDRGGEPHLRLRPRPAARAHLRPARGPAPALDLPVAAGSGAAEGDRVSLGALAGRVVVLDFWASWCGPCRQSIPALNQVHERYRGRIEMLGVNVEGNLPRSAVVQAHRDFGARFRSLQDEQGAAQAAYHVDVIPTLVVIDGAGVVRWVHTGVPDPDELAEHLEPLIAPRH